MKERIRKALSGPGRSGIIVRTGLAHLALMMADPCLGQTLLTTNLGSNIWTNLQDGPDNSVRVAAVTDNNRLLHAVTWEKAGATVRYRYRSIAPDGSLSAPITILSDWLSLDNPELLVRTDGTLSLPFFGDRLGEVGGDIFSGPHIKRLTSDSSFTTWTLDSVVYDGDNVQPGANAAALFNSNQEVVASTQGNAIRAFNLDTATAASTTPQTTCCTFDVSLNTQPGSGELVTGFYSSSQDEGGIYFQTLLPTPGPLSKAPGRQSDPRVEVPLVQAGNDLYTAYANEARTGGGITVWKVGGSRTDVVNIPGTEAATGVTLASDGQKLWVAWGVADGTSQTYVRRSNNARSKFGRLIKIKGPAGSTNTFYRSVLAGRGHLDLFSGTNTPTGDRSHYARIGVPLEIRVRSLSIPTARVRVRVTDGDAAVAGARVVAKPGGSAITDERGFARVRLGVGTSFVLKASKRLFTSVSLRVP